MTTGKLSLNNKSVYAVSKWLSYEGERTRKTIKN